MIRDPLCDKDYWDRNVNAHTEHISEMYETIKNPPGNPNYEPQYIYTLSQLHWMQIIARYSRGDPLDQLAAYFPPLLDAWERSERLGATVWTPQQNYLRRTWSVNIDSYSTDFWLIAMALCLEIPDDQWQRLLVLVGNAGEDTLLDRLIASRSPERHIGRDLCFRRPYGYLLDAIDAPRSAQAEKLKAFLDHWYPDLGHYKDFAREPQIDPYPFPSWYRYGSPRKIAGGIYHGLWCLEAAVAVKVFNLDDSLCIGHRYYPSDFAHPHGPRTHPPRPDVLPEPEPAYDGAVEDASRGWLRGLLDRCLNRSLAKTPGTRRP